MNNLTKFTCLSLLNHGSSTRCQVSKMSLYAMSRCIRKRIYSTEALNRSSTSTDSISDSNVLLKQTQCFSTTAVNMDLREKLSEMKAKGRQKLVNLVIRDKYNSKQALRFNAVRLYLSCTNALIYNDIHKYVNLSSSFSTWHKLVTLHIWILMTRLSREEEAGKKCRNFLINAFHEDIEQKITDIGEKLEIRVKTEEVDLLHHQFVAALLAYDEGLLSGDRFLANALWGTLFRRAEDVDPCDLEIMVQYVRKNVQLIHSLSREHVLANGMVPFLPMEGDTVTQKSYDMLGTISKTQLKDRF